MKSVVSWHYLMADIRAIRNWNVASVCLTILALIDQTVQHQLIIINDSIHSDDQPRDKKTDMFPLFL